VNHLARLQSQQVEADKKGNANRARMLHRHFLRVEKRISDLVRDWQQYRARLLLSRSPLLLLPRLNWSELIRKREQTRKYQHFVWSRIAHARACDVAMAKAQLVDRAAVIRVREDFSSKTCSSCGALHPALGGSRVYACYNCGACVDRDVNGSRNILLLALMYSSARISQEIANRVHRLRQLATSLIDRPWLLDAAAPHLLQRAFNPLLLALLF